MERTLIRGKGNLFSIIHTILYMYRCILVLHVVLIHCMISNVYTNLIEVGSNNTIQYPLTVCTIHNHECFQLTIEKIKLVPLTVDTTQQNIKNTMFLYENKIIYAFLVQSVPNQHMINNILIIHSYIHDDLKIRLYMLYSVQFNVISFIIL